MRGKKEIPEEKWDRKEQMETNLFSHYFPEPSESISANAAQ